MCIIEAFDVTPICWVAVDISWGGAVESGGNMTVEDC